MLNTLSLLFIISSYLFSIHNVAAEDKTWVEIDRAAKTLTVADRQLLQTEEWRQIFGQDLAITDLEMNWASYAKLAHEKVKFNAGRIETLQAPESTIEAIRTLLRLEKFIKAIESMAAFSAVQNAFAQNSFKWVMRQSSTLMYLGAAPTDDFKLILEGNPKIREAATNKIFQEAFEVVREQINRPEVIEAIQIYIEAGLTLTTPSERADALNLIKAFQNAGMNEITLQSPVLMTQIPYIKSKTGKWSEMARKVYQQSVADLLFNTPTGRIDLDSVNDSPVINGNIFDSIIELEFKDKEYQLSERTVTGLELAAIDHVARTLYGEARGCVLNKKGEIIEPQFHIVGRVIADRSSAILKRLYSEKKALQGNSKLFEQIKNELIKNQKHKSLLQASGGGIRDFGRFDRTDIPAPAQATSKHGQYSVWNGYLERKIKLSTLRGRALPKNMVDFDIAFKVGRNNAELQALNNALNPTQRPTTESNKLWQMSVDAATQLTLDLNAFIANNKWQGPVQRVYFYTHQGIDLPFAKDVTTLISGFHSEGKSYPRKDYGNLGLNKACNTRYFTPTSDDYGI